MGGFCASTYKRGIDFIQIPTTLLSMVDASIGGKLGIDFNEVKNSIGVFKDPKAVFVDPFSLIPYQKESLEAVLQKLLNMPLFQMKFFGDKLAVLIFIPRKTGHPLF